MRESLPAEVVAPEGYAPIVRLPITFNVEPLRSVLAAHPELWNERTERTAPEDSPHHGLDDIWLRFAEPGTMREDGSHDSIWYPSSKVLEWAEPMVLDLARAVGATRIGGVLVTRIKAGKECRPHTDPGWHARYYQKFAVQIDADPASQAFHFVGHELATAPGDVFWFDNAFTHWVHNDGPFDRITMIVCVRTERN